MVLIGKSIIDQKSKKYADARSALSAWCHEVESGAWNRPDELLERFPRASIVGKDRVVFRMKGNDYRLVVKINYMRGLVVVRFFGTHAEYDAINAEEV